MIGAHAERALNGYTKAAEVWNDCIADIDCENDSIKAGLQRRWEQASVHVGVFKIGVSAEKSEGRDKGAADQECKKTPDLPGCSSEAGKTTGATA